MIYIIDNKDSRIKYLIDELKHSYRLETIDELATPKEKGGVIIIPIQGIDNNGYVKNTEMLFKDIINEFNPRTVFVPKLNESLTNYNCEFIEYLTEDVEIINAKYTTEGAICLIISNTTKSLIDMKILISGFGKLGQTLANSIKEYGTEVSIYSNSESDLITSKIQGLNVIKSLNNIDELNFDVIVNTVPTNIYSLETLKRTSGCIYLELASYPYGVDVSKAKNLIKTFVGGGLPGKFTPESAGKLIARKIKGILNDRSN